MADNVPAYGFRADDKQGVHISAGTERHGGTGLSRPDVQGCGQGIRARDGAWRETDIRTADYAVGTAHLLHRRPGRKSDRNTFIYQIIRVMNNEILYILLPDYAAHEIVYLSQAIASDEYALKENPKYINKVVAPTMEPVRSIGGFRTLPDYSFETMPDDYAALVLIGGFGWTTPVAGQVVPIVRKAIESGKVVGAICNGASFMAKCGFLNAVKHTGNGLEQMKLWGGSNYTNPDGYIHAQTVSDKNIVTANGSAPLEFAKELLLLLENDTPERIEMYYQFYKQGFCTLFPAQNE